MSRFYTIQNLTLANANQEQLQAEIALLGNIAVNGNKGQIVCEVFDENVTDLQIQAVADAHDKNVLTSGQTLQNAKASIKALTTKANNHAARIALCFAAVLESEAQGEDANATFTRITDALNDASVSNGYRTAVMTAFTAKTGLSFDFANLGVVVLVTKQSFNAFSAEFFTRWAFVLTL